MVFRKAVMNSVACVAMGFALTDAVYGQVEVPSVPAPGVGTQATAEPDIADGAITRNGSLNADTTTNVQTAPAKSAASANVNSSDNGVNASVNAGVRTNGAQTNGAQAGVNAVPGTAGQSIDSSANANASTGVNGLQYHSNTAQGSYDAATSSSHGASYGNYPHQNQVCCNGSGYVQQPCSYGRGHGRRHHRRCCR